MYNSAESENKSYHPPKVSTSSSEVCRPLKSPISKVAGALFLKIHRVHYIKEFVLMYIVRKPIFCHDTVA